MKFVKFGIALVITGGCVVGAMTFAQAARDELAGLFG